MDKKKKKNNPDLPVIKSYAHGVYYLRNSYKRIFKILDAVILSNHIIINKALNVFYTGLLGGTNNALNLKNYSKLKKYYFDHPDNILDLSDEIRILWQEELRSKSLNFMAQIEKLYLKSGADKIDSKPFDKVMTGIDIAIDHHYKLDKDLTSKKDEIAEKREKLIYYEYKNRTGNLMIRGQKPIKFDRIVAIVLNFFYTQGSITNDYFDYRAFERKCDRAICSSEFSKKIKAINKRVNKETNGFVKSIISLGEKHKKTETNKYKWLVKT